MYIINNPDWIDYSLFNYKKFEDVPLDIFTAINQRLENIISTSPEVSIIISALDEETNIIRCIHSLSLLKTNISFEIIVVNNNSIDKTQLSLDNLHIIKLFQQKPGCGPSRQLAQENAKGKYILLADADCIYPPGWLTEMIKKLRQENVVAVYGRYSFLAETKLQRFKFFFYEILKDIFSWVRHFKHPYLNAFGISMGYIKEAGLRAGYIDHPTRGDDGRLVYDMMKYGKVLQVTSAKARVWTIPRTILREGSIWKAFITRFILEFFRGKDYFKKLPDHDTKTSPNRPGSLKELYKDLNKK